MRGQPISPAERLARHAPEAKSSPVPHAEQEAIRRAATAGLGCPLTTTLDPTKDPTMKRIIITLAAITALAAGTFASTAAASPNECRWSRDGAWHFSPLEASYYVFLGYVDPNGVTFQVLGYNWSVSYRTAYC
jgi:hypothetical protein